MKKEDGSRYTESELKAAGFGGKFKDGVLVIPGDEAAGPECDTCRSDCGFASAGSAIYVRHRT